MTAVDVDALDKLREAVGSVLEARSTLINGLPTRLLTADLGTVADDLIALPEVADLLAEVRRGRALREAVEGLAEEWERRNYDSGDPYTVGIMAGYDLASGRLRTALAAPLGTP